MCLFPASIKLLVSLIESKEENSVKIIVLFSKFIALRVSEPDYLISMLGLKIAIMFTVGTVFMRYFYLSMPSLYCGYIGIYITRGLFFFF